MGLFKKKGHILEFIGLFANVFIKEGVPDVSNIDPENVLPAESKSVIANKTYDFKFVVFYFLILDKWVKKKFKCEREDLNFFFGYAFGYNYKNAGYTEEQIQKMYESITSDILYFQLKLNEIGDAELKKKDLVFHLCEIFADRLFPKKKIVDVNDILVTQIFIAFDVARQVAQPIESSFNDIFKMVKLNTTRRDS